MILNVAASHFLGPGPMGVYAAVGALQGTLVVFISLGFEDSLTNYLGRHAERPGIVSFILRELLKRRIALALVSMGLLAALAGPLAAAQHISGYEWAIWLMAAAGAMTSVASLISFSLIAMFDVKASTIVRTVALVVNVALMFALVRHYQLLGVIWAFVIGSAIFLFGLIPAVYKRLTAPPEPTELKPVIRFGLGIYVNTVMNLTLGKQLGVLLLGLFAIGGVRQTEYVGYFNNAFNAKVLVDTLLIAGLGGTALAAASRLAERRGKEGLAVAWRLNVKLTTMLSVPTMIFFLFHARETIVLLYGHKFEPATTPFVWLTAWGILVRIYGGGASSTVMSAGGMVRLVVQQYIIGGFVSLILCYLAVLTTRNDDPMITLIAISVALSIGLLLVSALGFRVVKKTYHVAFPLVFTLKVILGGCIAGASTLWLHSSHSWVILPLSVQYAVVFYLAMRVLKPLTAEDFEVASMASRRITRIARPLVGEPLPETEVL